MTGPRVSGRGRVRVRARARARARARGRVPRAARAAAGGPDGGRRRSCPRLWRDTGEMQATARVRGYGYSYGYGYG